nr:uncharacterized protein LOC113700811 [Coffea arabica]
MTGDASQFIKLKPKTSGNVTFGDDNKAKTVGIGDVGKNEIDLKNADTQDSPTGEVNDRDTTTPNDLPRTWKFVQNHPRELIIGDPSEKMEEQNSEGNTVGGNEEPERATHDDETVTRTSDGLMMTMTPAQQSSFIEERNLLVPPIPENNENAHQKEPRPEPTGPTTGTEATPASSSQPKDKGKAPTTEKAYEEDDEETEEEVAPEQFRLARRRLGSSKITI